MLIPVDYFSVSEESKINVDIRGLTEIPVFFALTEKEGFVRFRLFDGRADYVGYFRNDPFFQLDKKIVDVLFGAWQDILSNA